MKRRDFLKCSLAVGAGLAASPSTYAFNGESKETGNDSSKLSKAPATKGGKPHFIFIFGSHLPISQHPMVPWRHPREQTGTCRRTTGCRAVTTHKQTAFLSQFIYIRRNNRLIAHAM